MRMIVFLAALLLPMTAHALMIRNLSDAPQTVVIDEGGAQETVTIQPGTAYRRVGGDIAVITPNGNWVQTEKYEEYAIWPNGEMYIQKRNVTRGRSQ